ncbi:MAG: cytochrome c3 family protein [Phycisphaerales bacterium]
MSVIFGKWMNTLPTVAAAVGLGGFVTVVGGFWYWATPKFWQVGYMPHQPALTEMQLAGIDAAKPLNPGMGLPGTQFPGFSHQIHAGKLGMDCRYCHTKVELSPEANIPNVATCYGCHAETHVDEAIVGASKVQFVRTAYEHDESINWRRVHKLPDYVRNFPHNIHVKAGVSCFSCHGQITAMPVVYQHEPLSMGWCLDCHRDIPVNPGKHLVPPDKVTQLVAVEQHFSKVQAGQPGDFPGFDARRLYESLRMNPPDNCGACHY